MSPTEHAVDEHTQSLRKMADEVLRGISGAQIRKMVLPSQLISMQETLASGDAEAVSFLMRDVVGEGLSLAAGSSLSGGSAMEALSLAQAQCFIDLRARQERVRHDDLAGLVKLVNAHRESLIEWVSTGQAGSDRGRPAVQNV